MKRTSLKFLSFAAAVVLVSMACAPAPTPPVGEPGAGVILPSDPSADTFQLTTMISGLNQPTNAAFAPDGRLFVAEKPGVIKTFDSVADQTPTITADLNEDVRNVGEHGLVGLTVDNAYPTRPFLYALYSWDITGLWRDGCKSNYQINGCKTGAKLVKITVDPAGVMVGQPQTLVDDRWCFQFSAHGAGSVEMLSDGSLVVTAGEGASFAGTDYGQFGGQQLFPPVDDLTPVNPCGDPPGGVGVAPLPTTGEGGSLRAQDVLTDGDPVNWDASLVRLNADTGEAMPDNPLVGVGTADDDAVVAHGFRNPNRITVQPGTDRVFVGNVGQNYAEEIEWIDVTAPVVENSGWPCREGVKPHPPFASLGNVICEDLIAASDSKTQLTDPWFNYLHNNTGAAVTGLAFVPPGKYPARFTGDLFFADYVLGNIWSLSLKPNGDLAPVPPEAVAYQVGLVDLDAAPDGYLYAVNIAQGSIEQLSTSTSPPVAAITTDAQSGPSPLTANLDASSSYQPGGGVLTYAWDLDDDGAFDDGTGPTAQVTFNDTINHVVRVEVTNPAAAMTVGSLTIYPGNTAPELTLDVTSPLPWVSGEPVEFVASATDAEDGAIDGSSIIWDTQIRHCYEPTDCHSHPYVSGSGATGSVAGPAHGFPSYLELTARVSDSRGQTTVVTHDLQPATATITITSNTPGAIVTLGETSVVTPATYTAILGDNLSVSTSPTQVIGGTTHDFVSWSDGGAATHQIDVTGDLNLQVQLAPQG